MDTASMIFMLGALGAFTVAVWKPPLKFDLIPVGLALLTVGLILRP